MHMHTINVKIFTAIVGNQKVVFLFLFDATQIDWKRETSIK